jgi:hypothetical protein
VVWIVSASLFLILGYRSLFSLAALTHGAVYFAWAAAQQIVYLSMTYLPLRDNLKSRRLAAGLAGAAFSIMHFPNPILVPATFVWGVASSLLFERCRTVWGLALLQMMLSSTLFWITPRELNRNFRIGPYYYRLHSSQAPGGTFAPPMSIWIVSEWTVTTDRAIHTGDPYVRYGCTHSAARRYRASGGRDPTLQQARTLAVPGRSGVAPRVQSPCRGRTGRWRCPGVDPCRSPGTYRIRKPGADGKMV